VAAAALPASFARAIRAPRARWALALAAPVATAIAIRVFAFEPFSVASDSMLPTLEAGDRLFVNKLVTPRRGDVVVFEHAGVRYVKRVVGLPGERVELLYGRVLVNGVAIEEWPTGTLRLDGKGRALVGLRERLGAVEHALLDDPERPLPDSATVVPDGHFFLLGDNRDHSADSRSFGEIPRSEIVGVASLWGGGARFEQDREESE